MGAGIPPREVDVCLCMSCWKEIAILMRTNPDAILENTGYCTYTDFFLVVICSTFPATNEGSTFRVLASLSKLFVRFLGRTAGSVGPNVLDFHFPAAKTAATAPPNDICAGQK